MKDFILKGIEEFLKAPVSSLWKYSGWLCCVTWKPRDKILETLKEENPETLLVVFSLLTVDHLYVMMCKTPVLVCLFFILNEFIFF